MKNKILASCIAALMLPGTVYAAPVIGDADMNGSVDAADAALVMQKTLTSTYKMPIEDDLFFGYSSAYIDVSGNGSIDSADAAEIMQKALDSSYKFTVQKKYEITEQTIYFAAQTYVTDRYAMGDPAASVSVDELVDSGLLFYRPEGEVYIKLSDENPLVVDYVIYNGAICPDREKESAIEVYNAAQTYIRVMYQNGTPCSSVTVDKLVGEGILRTAPDYDISIKLGGYELTDVESVTCNGRVYTGSELYVLKVSDIFAAAQTYATDMYANHTPCSSITAEELADAHLLAAKPEGEVIIKLNENNSAVVDSVIYNGEIYPGLAFENAAAIYYAAQIYATDMYAAGKPLASVTADKLAEAGLLEYRPYAEIFIKLNDKNSSVVEYVAYNGSIYHRTYFDHTLSVSGIYSAAQAYVTDMYAAGSAVSHVTINDLVDAGLIGEKPKGHVWIELDPENQLLVKRVIFNGCVYSAQQNVLFFE